MKIKKRKFNKAFSLAESMIVLVVVSIILGVSAPLVARHFAKGTNSVVSVSGNNINTAQGNNTFQVGDEKNPPATNNNKLEVYGDTDIKSNGITIKNGENTTVLTPTCNNRLGCTSLSFKNQKDEKYAIISSATSGLKLLRKDTPKIYETNKVYSNTNCNNFNHRDTYCSTEIDGSLTDGYLLISNALAGYDIRDSLPANVNVENIALTDSQSSIYANVRINNYNALKLAVLPAIIPISKNKYYHCNDICFFVPIDN